MAKRTTDEPDTSPWDFEKLRKDALSRLTTSRLTSYKTVKSRPRTSDRPRDSVTELIPEAELQEFTLTGSVMKNPFLRGLIRRRDLLMAVLNTVLMFASATLFVCVQIMQQASYNRLIPDKFYTDTYMQRHTLQQRYLQAYVLTLMAYVITFNLSVRWKLEIDAEIELERLSNGELIRFTG